MSFPTRTKCPSCKHLIPVMRTHPAGFVLHECDGMVWSVMGDGLLCFQWKRFFSTDCFSANDFQPKPPADD